MTVSTNQPVQWIHPKWVLSNKAQSARAIILDRPCVVCILNITPDSFSDGGEYNSVEMALDRARSAVSDGADMLDIGGESTRPGAERISVDEQINRVIPVIGAIRDSGMHIPISIDTTQSIVAREALKAGADAINDVSAMTEDPDMMGLASSAGCGVVLMHRLTTPDRDSYSDQYDQNPVYTDVVGEVVRVLGAQRDELVKMGVDNQHIVLDPGMGFGKSVEDNLALINRTGEIAQLGCPVMSGLSRKSFVGRLGLGRDSEPSERVGASVGLSVVHLLSGARIFRVHDVAQHRSALDAAWSALAR
ncbi:MAG: dihydropteroate synthase [Phycisphaerales bacterium]